MGIIAWPFGKILQLCYMIVGNYGWALLLFTVIIKLIMLPSSMKQQVSVAKTARLQPKLEQLKKKYANNKEKLNEATMELYSKENINPMGSCMPMVLTFVLLFAVIEVVYAPLSYIGSVSKEQLNQAQTTVYETYLAAENLNSHQTTVKDIMDKGEASVYDTLISFKSEEKSSLAKLSDDRLKEIAQTFENHPELDTYMTDPDKVSKRLIAGGASNRTQLIVISVAKDYPELFDAEVSKLCNDLDYTYLGVYLGQYPKWKSILVLIPILSLVSQLALTFVSTYYQKKNSGGVANQNSSMNLMLYGMPLISFWIAFSFPAGIGIYWIFSSALALVQTVGLNLYYTPQRIDKILEKQNKKARKKPSLYQMALEQQKAQNSARVSENDDNDDGVSEEVKLSRAEKKEAERSALNEARRRYAEKYGDDQ